LIGAGTDGGSGSGPESGNIAPVQHGLSRRLASPYQSLLAVLEYYNPGGALEDAVLLYDANFRVSELGNRTFRDTCIVIDGRTTRLVMVMVQVLSPILHAPH
jgi:hypothetical protein